MSLLPFLMQSLLPQCPPSGFCPPRCSQWSQDVLNQAGRRGIKDLYFFINNVLPCLSALHLTDEPEFSHNLDHMKNIFEVDMPFYKECVPFTVQQTNKDSQVWDAGGEGVSLADSNTHPFFCCCCLTNPDVHTSGVWEARHTASRCEGRQGDRAQACWCLLTEL